MNIKNNKVYLFAIIIFIWNIFYIYLKNIINYHNIINYVLWISLSLVCTLMFNKGYKRNKYKDILFQDIIISTLLYIIIYYLLGFVIGFQKSPLNFGLFNIIKNLIKYVTLRIIIEIVKYYLIKENNTKIFIIIITIIFIIINVDISYLTSIIEQPKEIFKYISSTIIPLSIYGIVGTYVIKNATLKSNLLLQITPILLTYIIPISPKLDWYLYSVFHIVYLLCS